MPVAPIAPILSAHSCPSLHTLQGHEAYSTIITTLTELKFSPYEMGLMLRRYPSIRNVSLIGSEEVAMRL